MTPRLIRLRDAPQYLGMDIHRFNAEVRPDVIVIPIGKQGIAFDRLGYDAWADNYKRLKGRPVAPTNGRNLWDANTQLDSRNAMRSGTSINKSLDAAFAKAVARATLGKRNATSQNV